MKEEGIANEPKVEEESPQEEVKEEVKQEEVKEESNVTESNANTETTTKTDVSQGKINKRVTNEVNLLTRIYYMKIRNRSDQRRDEQMMHPKR